MQIIILITLLYIIIQRLVRMNMCVVAFRRAFTSTGYFKDIEKGQNFMRVRSSKRTNLLKGSERQRGIRSIRTRQHNWNQASQHKFFQLIDSLGRFKYKIKTLNICLADRKGSVLYNLDFSFACIRKIRVIGNMLDLGETNRGLSRSPWFDGRMGARIIASHR